MLLSRRVDIITNDKGRGVYAAVPIAARELIEACPVIIVGKHPERSSAREPCNEWAYDFDGQSAIALGAGSLYNHSWRPRANWRCMRRQSGRTIEIYALRAIPAGVEITINYLGLGEKPTRANRAALGFQVLP